jgi:hypothetical protein
MLASLLGSLNARTQILNQHGLVQVPGLYSFALSATSCIAYRPEPLERLATYTAERGTGQYPAHIRPPAQEGRRTLRYVFKSLCLQVGLLTLDPKNPRQHCKNWIVM